MERLIAHSDCNCFYASVEMLRNPRLRNVPFAVCGSREDRHGIVLTANYPAKGRGVKTGMAIWEARQACDGLHIASPNMADYHQFSDFTRGLYAKYTDRIEPFGLDEAWLDLTGTASSFDEGVLLVNNIRERVKRELGITVSIGLSDNKVFAKLGSDIKKPDATTVIPRDRYREIVWPLPVGELLYVGRATEVKLRARNIKTIGALAQTEPMYLKSWFGKVGLVLHAFANGEDLSPVAEAGVEPPPKSIGNSHTTARDLRTDQDVKIVIYALAESVGARLMEQGYLAQTIEFSYIDSNMEKRGVRQCKIPVPTCISGEIADTAFMLFRQCYGHWPKPLRGIGVRGSNLVEAASVPRQISMFENPERVDGKVKLERAINDIRRRYGNKAIQRGIMFTAPELSKVDAKKDHTAHPVGLFKGGGMDVTWAAHTTAITP